MRLRNRKTMFRERTYERTNQTKPNVRLMNEKRRREEHFNYNLQEETQIKSFACFLLFKDADAESRVFCEHGMVLG